MPLCVKLQAKEAQLFTDPRSRLETFSAACSFTSDAQTESRWCAGRNTRWAGHTRHHAPISRRPTITLSFEMASLTIRLAEVSNANLGRGRYTQTQHFRKQNRNNVPDQTQTIQLFAPPPITASSLRVGAGSPAEINAECSFIPARASMPCKRVVSVIHRQQRS